MDVDEKAKNFDEVRNKVKQLMREGYSASQILTQVCPVNTLCALFANLYTFQFHDLVIEHPSLSAHKKAQCALVFAEADKALCDGADEELWIFETALRVFKAVS